MTRVECIQKIRHIQDSMYTFEFEDGKSHKFKADDADKFYYYLDMIAKYLEEDVPKEKEPKTDTWSIKDVANTLAKHGLIEEQETCEDAVSRQAVIDTIYHECSGENLDIDFAKVLLLQRKIKALPSVNPQKTGHWIDADGDNAICGCCNRLNHLYGTYCKHCGAKMSESEEWE